MSKTIKLSSDNQKYVIDIDRVQQIDEIDSVRPVPNTEDYVCGVTDFRGDIVSVVDLARLIGEDDTDFTEEELSEKRVVYITHESIDNPIGLLVAEVEDIIDKSNISEKDNNFGSEFCGGVVENEDELVVALDIGTAVQKAT